MNAEALLSRLDKVRQTGHGQYIACCPAHDDRSPSLAVTEKDDGRVLLWCFAGCETADVLYSVGLEFHDVMPERIESEHSYRPLKWINAKDALSTLDHEALVVATIGADFLKYKEIDDKTWSRLATAVNRINETRAKCAPARVGK